MTPLNHLINYSSELAQRPSFFQKTIGSRFVTAISIPFELLAILENTIKLPFQTATTIVKIPAKIVNIIVDSRSLKEFESTLASPLDVITTTIKIAGFAIGLLFTATLGILSPHKNFRLHCSLSLIDNFKAQKLIREARESRQKEIDCHEKIIECRLKATLDILRQQAQLIEFLPPEQRQEIESLTCVECPPIEDLFEETPVIEDSQEAEGPPEDKVEENDAIITPEAIIAEEEPLPETAIVDDKTDDIIPEQNELVDVPVIDQDVLSSSTTVVPEDPEEVTADNVDDSPTVIPIEDEQVLENEAIESDEGIELVNGG